MEQLHSEPASEVEVVLVVSELASRMLFVTVPVELVIAVKEMAASGVVGD